MIFAKTFIVLGFCIGVSMLIGSPTCSEVSSAIGARRHGVLTSTSRPSKVMVVEPQSSSARCATSCSVRSMCTW